MPAVRAECGAHLRAVFITRRCSRLSRAFVGVSATGSDPLILMNNEKVVKSDKNLHADISEDRNASMGCQPL